MREHRVADRAARAEHHVDDARRQPRLLVDLHQEVGRVDGRRRRLEDDGVPHQRRRGRQVPGDRGEVERRDGEDEALERAVLDPVPDAGRGDRLLAHQPVHVGDVEAPEVGQLARRVDLGLERRLRLAEHRGGVHRVAPRPGEQLGRPQEDRRPRLPRERRPLAAGLGGRGDRPRDLLLAAVVVLPEDVLVVVGHDDVGGAPGAHLLAADHHRDLDLPAGHLVQAGLEAGPLGEPGG